MTTTKCPKCGAERLAQTKTETSDYITFKCGTDTLDGEVHVQSRCCELTTLRAKLKKAKEALKPFADVVEVIDRNVMCDGGPIPDESFLLARWEWNTSSELTIGDCRKAKTILTTLE